MTFVIIVCAAALVLLISYICVRETFYVRSSGRDEPKVPHEKQYIGVSDKIMGFINGASAIGYEDVYTESHDGLRLHAKFYAGREGAPTHILIHGYRSSALLDMGGALIDAVERGDNALLIDQRAHAGSQGKYLTFGYNESRDVLRWINYINERLGRDNPIVLQGLSMALFQRCGPFAAGGDHLTTPHKADDFQTVAILQHRFGIQGFEDDFPIAFHGNSCGVIAGAGQILPKRFAGNIQRGSIYLDHLSTS